MNQKQKDFVLGMLQHGDKLKAYRAAYPNSKNEEAAIKSAERLLRDPQVAREIQSVRDNIYTEAVQKAYALQVQQSTTKLLSVMKKREILTQIATCEMKVGRYIKDDNGYRQVYEDPRPRDIICAIELDTKLEEACNRMRSSKAPELCDVDIYIDGRLCTDPSAPFDPDVPKGLVMLPKKRSKSNPENETFALVKDELFLKQEKREQKETNALLVEGGEEKSPGKVWSGGEALLLQKLERQQQKQQERRQDPMSGSFYKLQRKAEELAPPPKVFTKEEVQELNKQYAVQAADTSGKMHFPEKQKFMPHNKRRK